MTIDEALKWISDLFEMPASEITEDTPRDQIETWDSLGMLTLMARLDSELDIILKEDEVGRLKSVRDIIKIMARHGKLDNKPQI